MKAIQPVSIWVAGEEKIGNMMALAIVNDNLATTATFFWQIIKQTEVPAPDPEQPAALTNEVLSQGNLTITGQDYQDWDSDPSINDAAYVWAAGKLNVTLAS